MAQQRGTHRAQPHSRKARPAFNFWPQGLWVCPRALAPHTCTAQNNSQTSLGKKCCGNPGNRPGEPTLGRTEGAGAAEACWTAHGEALCSRLWKVLDEQPLPLPLPHRNCPFVATTLWKEDTTTDKKQSEPAGGRGGSDTAGRLPACPEATRGIKLSPWVASSTVEPGTSPAAENTTVKPIIQRIKSES